VVPLKNGPLVYITKVPVPGLANDSISFYKKTGQSHCILKIIKQIQRRGILAFNMAQASTSTGFSVLHSLVLHKALTNPITSCTPANEFNVLLLPEQYSHVSLHKKLLP